MQNRERVEVKRNVNREKQRARARRHVRVRKKVIGTPERPRLCVTRSLNHIYAQIIDDTTGRTLVSASSLKLALAPIEEAPAPEPQTESGGKGAKGGKGKEGKKEAQQRPLSLKMRRSIAVGRMIAEAALAKGIKTVAFDRGGYRYHGRVAALAKAAREGGLDF